MSAKKAISVPAIDFRAIADEFQGLNPNDPGAWPKIPKMTFLAAIFVALVAAGWWFARRNDGTGTTARRGVKPPLFIAGFVALSALFAFVPALGPAAPWIVRAARAALTLTLFLIGAGLDRASVRAVGARPFVQGVILWVLVGSGTLAALKLGWIH